MLCNFLHVSPVASECWVHWGHKDGQVSVGGELVGAGASPFVHGTQVIQQVMMMGRLVAVEDGGDRSMVECGSVMIVHRPLVEGYRRWLCPW